MVLSRTAQRLLRHIIHKAHATCQCPFIWDTTKKRFGFDETLRFKILSKLVWLNDVNCSFLLLFLGIVNYSSDLSYSLTMILLLIAGVNTHNIILDINLATNGRVWLQWINSFLLLTQARKGIISSLLLLPGIGIEND